MVTGNPDFIYTILCIFINLKVKLACVIAKDTIIFGI